MTKIDRNMPILTRDYQIEPLFATSDPNLPKSSLVDKSEPEMANRGPFWLLWVRVGPNWRITVRFGHFGTKLANNGPF